MSRVLNRIRHICCKQKSQHLQLSIIIVNYNVKYFLEQCLCSVLKACAGIDAEIFVVDNYSTDGSKEFFAGKFPPVQFIWKNENAGFAKANNEAVRLARGEKILFLNPDTVLPEDCLQKCLQFFTQQKNIGVLGVRMIDGSGNFLPESKRGFPSAFTSFCKMTGLAKLFPTSKIFARYYLGHLQENESNEVDVLSGAFMMVDKKIIDSIGSFDEDYFMYAEDIDLSYRIQKSSYKNFYFAGTTIIHFKGESAAKKTTGYFSVFYGAMILFVKKHYPKLSGNMYILFLKLLIAGKKLLGTKTKAEQPGKLRAMAYVVADGRVFAKELEQYFSQINNINNITDAPQGNVVIFNNPDVSFTEMISKMQQHKNRYSFFIHGKNTKSIVGSDDKNKAGVAIALKE